MTLRGYPCPWCGSFRGNAKDTRHHILECHRALLIMGLAPIEAFGTRKPLDPPRNAAKPVHGYNPGVSGEGDPT